MRSMLAGVAKTGSETAQRLEGFASVRSTLAGLAERGLNAPPLCKGRGTTKWWKGCKKTIPHRLRRSSLYTKEPFKINRGSAVPLLFDFLSYLLSQKTRLLGGFFVSFFSLSDGAYKLAVICVDDERVAHIEVV